MLLSRKENGAGGKTDTPPATWFADKSETYLKKHLIPADRALWEVDQFEDFIAARKILLLDNFKALKIIQ